MIDGLAGHLVAAEGDWAVLDVNGIRFRCEISQSTASQLPAPGKECTLLTRLRFNVNEGDFLLFGFATETERECFDIFTAINGIGPRKGLMILSQIEIASFARAIIANDLTYLSKIKGIGKKTAERLVVELREKMVPYSAKETNGGAAPLPVADNVRDAIDGLVVLGCRLPVAEKAVSEAIKELGEEAPAESLIRVALRYR